MADHERSDKLRDAKTQKKEKHVFSKIFDRLPFAEMRPKSANTHIRRG
jgi:hypothetical protein